MHTVSLPLSHAPRVADAGLAVHGVGTPHDRFQLPRLWQLHLYRYHAGYRVGGDELSIRPGTLSLAPPDTVVEYWYRGRSEHLYVHFDLPGGVDRAAEPEVRAVPVLQDAAEAAPLLTDLLQRAIRARTQDSAAAATASVWAALWHVADLADATAARRRHPVVDAATAYIEARLADPITVAGLARHCGISHNQLTRLFGTHLSSTVVGYIRARRMARARHLLTSSTLPIATVAASVGIPDLQAFNKTCRRELGAPPRAVRDGANAEHVPPAQVRGSRTAARAASSRATGTRKGEQET
ncbi:helix-turn-helix transcriptional regulator [Actinospica durhamensis]|uniref:Helix-turn-helix transcriptional regulator n=1 Tax=Actinospica durhamensis TaxID=1508375 RepID=A0A941ETE3_9ACTN|nr:AraC family transcriptional regulator [Actinospica durhamensis]MBR7836956.1 helix-turn-helix transcriptional regulator [Actinospica durhamensis]